MEELRAKFKEIKQLIRMKDREHMRRGSRQWHHAPSRRSSRRVDPTTTKGNQSFPFANDGINAEREDEESRWTRGTEEQKKMKRFAVHNRCDAVKKRRMKRVKDRAFSRATKEPKKENGGIREGGSIGEPFAAIAKLEKHEVRVESKKTEGGDQDRAVIPPLDDNQRPPQRLLKEDDRTKELGLLKMEMGKIVPSLWSSP